jgi:hypothetical protein
MSVLSSDTVEQAVQMPSFFATFVKEIYEPTQLLLIGVGVLYAMVGGLEEAVTALVVILLMANVRRRGLFSWGGD